MGTRWFRPQFSISALVLFTVGAAALLACFAGTGRAEFPMGGLLWLAAISLAGVLDFGSRSNKTLGPISLGGCSGALAGLSFCLFGMLAARIGFPQLIWPNAGFVFYAYWWVATGGLVGGMVGCLVRQRRPQLPSDALPGAPPAEEWHLQTQRSVLRRRAAQLQSLGSWSSSWFASIHLHVVAGTVLSITAVGLSGRLPAGGQLASASGDLQPLLRSDSLAGEHFDGTKEASLRLDLPAEPQPVPDSSARSPDGSQEPQDVAPPEGALEELISEDEILERVAMLSQDDRRTEAKIWLMSRPTGAYPVLKQICQRSSGSTREQLNEVLGAFAAQAGSAGLRLSLVADKTTVKTGETVNFTTIIRNTNDRAVNLYLGYSLHGISFETGAAFVVRDAKGALQSPEWTPRRGLCGTGAGPIYAVIDPGSTVSFQTPVSVGSATTATFTPTGVTYSKPVEAYRFSGLHYPTARSDLHRFSVRHEVVADHHENGSPTQRHGTFHPAARQWLGNAASNEVVVRIVR